MEKPQHTQLGTKQLYKQHSVMIEGGMVPRARVMDQHIVDRYLMKGLLELKQHRAAEYLLGQAARAGLWARGVNWLGTGSAGKRDHIPFGMFPFGRSLVTIKSRYDPYHAYVVKRVICHEWDVSDHEYNMQCLTDGLNCVADLRMGWRENPLRYIKSAAGGRERQVMPSE